MECKQLLRQFPISLQEEGSFTLGNSLFPDWLGETESEFRNGIKYYDLEKQYI